MENAIFIDWLSMYQVHYSTDSDYKLPVINDGNVWCVSPDGEIEWTTEKHFTATGSFDSKLRVRCDGFKVEVSGNIGKWNRPDNLFGFGVEDCVDRWNRFLNLYNLPPFSKGEPYFAFGHKRLQWSGAIITRIDLTKNYACWSRSNLRSYMGWLGSHQQGRRKVGVTPDGNTITWGEGSKFMYEKFYDKWAEMFRMRKRNAHVSEDVMQYAENFGIGRHELELKTRFLTQNGLRFLGEVTMGKLYTLYRERSGLILQDKVPVDDFNDIPKPYRGTAKDWRDGADMVEALSRRTYFRHRQYLKQHYGIDISTRCNIAHLPMAVKHIEPTALEAPDWYRKRYG